MPTVLKILLVSIVTGIFAQASSSEIEGIRINTGSSMVQQSDDMMLISYSLRGLRDTPVLRTALNTGQVGNWTFDPTATTLTIHASAVTQLDASLGSSVDLPRANTDTSTVMSVLLLIFGLIGISRLRGRPMK